VLVSACQQRKKVPKQRFVYGNKTAKKEMGPSTEPSTFLAVAAILSTLALSNCQGCGLYSTTQLETLTSNTITGEPNTVCLASGSSRDIYREASVVATVGGQLRQLDLSCSGSTWSLVSNNSPTGGSLTTSVRRDCAACIATSNDPTFDDVTHCVG